jgi:hypothetical protein
MCRRHPNIGWVYRCTQDHEGFLPESDFTTTGETAPIIIRGATSIWRLKQWMYEAVLKGQYTVEQFSTLFQQRQGVKKAIFSQSDSTATPSTSVSSDDSCNSTDLTSTTLTSIASSYPDDDSEMNPDENGISHQDKLYQSTITKQLLDDRDIATIKGRSSASDPSYPACAWTCCQTCRPTYRDRAWLSLDAVVSGPTKAPPSWEFENRRISEARIVANMGLPKPGPPFPLDDSRYDSSSEAPLSNDGNLAESETDKFAYGALNGSRTKGGFRATVRRTLKGAISHTRATSSESQTSSKNSSQSSLRRLGRSMLFRPRSSSQSTIAYNPRVIEDGQLQESLMLMIAINTPLPDAATDVENLHDGEVEVEDGVAVTEEGIGMNAADIIMQI